MFKGDSDNEDEYDEHKHHYFHNKRSALQWLAKEIRRRENLLPDPDRDLYGTNVERKISALYKSRKWEEISPYYAVYLYKKRFEY